MAWAAETVGAPSYCPACEEPAIRKVPNTTTAAKAEETRYRCMTSPLSTASRQWRQSFALGRRVGLKQAVEKEHMRDAFTGPGLTRVRRDGSCNASGQFCARYFMMPMPGPLVW